MKIISKFKDFYDYKVVKYGVDEKLVYNRKTYYDYYKILHINILTDENGRVSVEDFNKNLKENIKYFKHNNHNKVLIIGEKIYRYWAYYTDTKEIIFNDGKKFEFFITFNDIWNDLFSYDRKRFLSYLNTPKDDILFNEPMILIEYVGKADRKTARFDNSIYKITYNPNLSQMGIYFDEDFIWQSLVEFLSNKRSEKEITPEVSNENKILSKGFDLKTSFRPNMKKRYKGDI